MESTSTAIEVSESVKNNKADDSVRDSLEISIIDLKKLHLDYLNQEINFYDELHQLDLKYKKIYDPIFKKRFEIINGIDNDFKKLEGDVKDKKDEFQDNVDKGIPDFWLKVFLNSKIMSRMINNDDEAILKHMKDLTYKYISEDQMDFVLEFHFEPNEYFSNSVLTKEYQKKWEINLEDPYDCEGPEIVGCKGCEIDWKKEENGASNKMERFSFFNFFNPSDILENSEMYESLMADFAIGIYIKNKIIPKAILYYTGDISEQCDDSSDSCLSENSMYSDFASKSS